MTAVAAHSVRDTIERSLADEPQSVVKVNEQGQLRTDLVEYVLTEQLAREFEKVLERVVDAARPSGGETDQIGVWISGFFGSGKSHFAKLVGHLLADTAVQGGTTRELFRKLLHPGRASDERLRELLQQAQTYRLAAHLVLLDMVTLSSAAGERSAGITFLRAFYESLGLSKVIAFAERELALFLIQTQVNPGSGRLVALGNLSPLMREALKAADAYLRAHMRDLGIDRDPKQYDFTVQAVNLNQAKEGAETAIAFFISLVSALLDRPTDPTTVVAGEMSVRGMLQRVENLAERLELAGDAGARKVLVPSENKRDLADVPDEILNRLQPVFYTDPINAAIRAMGLE
jgi:ATP-dependent Lon protease